jgi:hypothetical protein
MKSIDRGALLAGVGVGSLAPSALLGALARPTPAAAGEGALAVVRGVTFDLSTIASSGIVNRQKVAAFITGAGAVNGRSVSGSGRIVLFNQLDHVPKGIVSTGNWRAARLITANFIGTYGGLVAGKLLLEGQFSVQGVRQPQLIRLQIVTNLGAAGLFTGERGGLQLSLPGTIFDAGHDAGPFVTGRRKGRGFFLRAGKVRR